MGKTYLIDTNTLLDYVAGSLPDKAQAFVEDILDVDFNVSVVNRIEVLGHESANQDLSDFMNLATTHQLTYEVMEQTIHLRKQKKIKLPDAIIAATAVVYGFTILTRNIKDFHHIDGLDCINPHELF